MLWIYAVPALCLFVCLPFFLHYKQILRYRLAAAYKTAGTLSAAVPALIAAIVSTAAAVACFCLLQPYMGFTVAQWYDAIRPRTEQSGI